MTGFAPAWLALREPYDARARAADLETALAGILHGRCRILDLAAGAGSNLRHLAPRLACEQDWTLVDHDPGLLAIAARSGLPATLDQLPGVRTRCVDLARDLGALALEHASLVTASALLDLVSAGWLRALAGGCAAARVPLLLALTYDGRIGWTPREPWDDEARARVNAHQRGDKGFGPALGPDATDEAERLLGALGYRVRTAPSDWVLGPGDGPLQRALLDDWARAAGELSGGDRAACTRWHARRRAQLDAGRSHLVVGHRDLLAIPA